MSSAMCALELATFLSFNMCSYRIFVCFSHLDDFASFSPWDPISWLFWERPSHCSSSRTQNLPASYLSLPNPWIRSVCPCLHLLTLLFLMQAMLQFISSAILGTYFKVFVSLKWILLQTVSVVAEVMDLFMNLRLFDYQFHLLLCIDKCLFLHTPTQAELFLSLWLQALCLTVLLVLHKAFWTYFLLRKRFLASTPTSCHTQRNKSEASVLAAAFLLYCSLPSLSTWMASVLLLYISPFILPVVKTKQCFKKDRLAMFMLASTSSSLPGGFFFLFLSGDSRPNLFKSPWVLSHFILCGLESGHMIFTLFWNGTLTSSCFALSCRFWLASVSSWWKKIEQREAVMRSVFPLSSVHRTMSSWSHAFLFLVPLLFSKYCFIKPTSVWGPGPVI